MKLQFPISRIKELSDQYKLELPSQKWNEEIELIEDIFPAFRKRGYLTRKEFLKVCHWKSPRPRKQQETNDEKFIKEISRLSLSTPNEQLRIQIWTLLKGVNWRTASAFLHFSFPKAYPILDVYALKSVGKKFPSSCNFIFWQRYAKFCRSKARKAKVNMRTLDQALWLYSKQKPRH